MKLAAVLTALFALACCTAKAPEPEPRPDRRSLFVLPVDPGAEVPAGHAPHALARAEVAADDTARERGLMGRTSLRPDHGMLFVYPRESTRGFWMKNTLIPLAIAFSTATGRIVDIQEMTPGGNVSDGKQRRYRSAAPATYALEMEAGWFDRNGIRVGDRMVFHPAVGGIPGR